LTCGLDGGGGMVHSGSRACVVRASSRNSTPTVTSC